MFVDSISTLISYVIGISGFVVVYGRECYNFREEPKVRNCPHGCCGDEYAQYCCDATLQIVGSAIGAALVLAAIIAAVYYCYRKKRSKRRLAQGQVPARTTFVTRFGFRTRPANHREACSRQRPRVQAQHAVPIHQVHLNPAYIHTIPDHLVSGYNYPAGEGHSYPPPGAPSAPMPPPYSMTIAPPPYSDSKPVAPPPDYMSVIHGNKYADLSDTMPPPSS